MLVGVGLGKI